MTQKVIHLELDGHKVVVRLDGNGSGAIESDLKDYDEDSDDYNSAIDGVESLLLAHACAGVDIQSQAYIEGLKTAIEAIANNL